MSTNVSPSDTSTFVAGNEDFGLRYIYDFVSGANNASDGISAQVEGVIDTPSLCLAP